jgi:hypothetical protein
VKYIKHSTVRRLLMASCLTMLIALTSGPVAGQEPSKPQTDDVLRINADLVQTAITVVDKSGHFLDGLDRGRQSGSELWR